MRFSGWFAALFTVVMLALCGTACWYCLSLSSLNAANTDLETKLETSRQRETKQQVEYDAVCQALPEAQAELAELQPLADAAKAAETDLRAQRKQLRSDIAALNEVLPGVEQANAALKEIIDATQALQAQLPQRGSADD